MMMPIVLVMVMAATPVRMLPGLEMLRGMLPVMLRVVMTRGVVDRSIGHRYVTNGICDDGTRRVTVPAPDDVDAEADLRIGAMVARVVAIAGAGTGSCEKCNYGNGTADLAFRHGMPPGWIGFSGVRSIAG